MIKLALKRNPDAAYGMPHAYVSATAVILQNYYGVICTTGAEIAYYTG
jgi:hypothetical protein